MKAILAKIAGYTVAVFSLLLAPIIIIICILTQDRDLLEQKPLGGIKTHKIMNKPYKKYDPMIRIVGDNYISYVRSSEIISCSVKLNRVYLLGNKHYLDVKNIDEVVNAVNEAEKTSIFSQ